MRAELLRAVIDTTLALSVALLIVESLRRPLRIAFGARSAYWVWALVPALVAAVLLPAPSPMLAAAQVSLPGQMRAVFTAAANSESIPYYAILTNLAIAAWVAGACAI